jgi:hypothetical protein
MMVFTIVAALMVASTQAGDPKAQVDWQAAARQDVAAAYDSYLENHPGAHDPANPGFRQQLEKARAAGEEIAAGATSEVDYSRALGAFSGVISDGHAKAISNQLIAASKQPRQWPGFIAVWRGRMLVHQVSDGSPVPIGAQILACDGLPVVDFVRKQVEFRGLRSNEAGQWWSRSSQAFFGTEGLASGPSRCTFRLADGTVRDAELHYSAVPENFGAMLASATDGDRTPIGLSEPRPGMFLIGMQDFNPNEAGVKAYHQLFDTLRQRRGELLNARAVIIDLRHNEGGSSAWSSDGARALWGKSAVDPLADRKFKDVRIWWRASKDNLAYMTKLEAQVRDNGFPEIAEGVRKIAKGMSQANAHGDPFFVEGAEPPKRLPTPVPSDFHTPVYVITSGRCASACLDALDTFTLFDNVKLIGAPTSADSTYMEVRTAPLPSGQGILVIPNKVWVGRPRASGEVYGPHIVVNDLDWSTASFLDRIERDLVKR